eukprot:1041855-Heterocapsa_arctica.AAC.1
MAAVLRADVDLQLQRLVERSPELLDPLDVEDLGHVPFAEGPGGVPDGHDLLEEGHGGPSCGCPDQGCRRKPHLRHLT